MTGTSQRASHKAETRSARPTVGRACCGSASPSKLSCSPAFAAPEPCPPPTRNAPDPVRAPIKPMIPAALTINGNGTLRRRADEHQRGERDHRLAFQGAAADATRCTACNTIANSAAFRPKNREATEPAVGRGFRFSRHPPSCASRACARRQNSDRYLRTGIGGEAKLYRDDKGTLNTGASSCWLHHTQNLPCAFSVGWPQEIVSSTPGKPRLNAVVLRRSQSICLSGFITAASDAQPFQMLANWVATTLSYGICPCNMPMSRANWFMPATKPGGIDAS